LEKKEEEEEKEKRKIASPVGLEATTYESFFLFLYDISSTKIEAC